MIYGSMWLQTKGKSIQRKKSRIIANPALLFI